MKLKSLSIAVAFAFSGVVFAADAPPAEMPKTPESWAQSMWDFTRNPNALKEPKQFVPFFTAATEPAFYTALGMQALDPSMWGYMVNSMMNPAAYGAWMPLMTDPNVYMKWLAASLDPNFYTALLTQFTDPGKMMRWLMAPVDPKVWGLMMQSLNPAMYLKWMMSPLDPQWLRAGINTMNPGMYMGWLGSALNPGSYGDLWKGFLTYPIPGVPTVPSTTAPGATLLSSTSFTASDRTALVGFILLMKGQQAPAAPATPRMVVEVMIKSRRSGSTLSCSDILNSSYPYD